MDPTSKQKLTPRAFHGRYMFGVDLNHIRVTNIQTGKYHKVRACDFHPYHPASDPVHTHATAFKCHLPHPDPNHITPLTPPPSTLKQAKRYPDAKKWETAHNAELDKLDADGAIHWLTKDNIPKGTKLIPLLMTYRYKRTPTGLLLEHKARCALRGDLMIPTVHFNPNHTTAFMADKTTVRLSFALKAALNLQIDHFDIKSEFVQERYQFDKPVYVRQHPQFNGSYKHPGKAGLLIKNIYGGPSGSYHYLKGAEEFLTSIGFTQCDSDPCLFFRLTIDGFIIITLNIDDFLVLATHLTLIDELYANLQRKYPNRVKRLGQPYQYLGWKIDYFPNGGVKISQPNYVHKVLQSARMTDCNGRPCPHVDGAQYHGPTELDTLTPHLKERYQSVLGELRYISGCTRPDIVYYVNRLSAAAHKPTKRHWLIMKNTLKYLKRTPDEGILYSPPTTTPISTNDVNTGPATSLQTPTHSAPNAAREHPYSPPQKPNHYKPSLPSLSTPSPLSWFSDADFAGDRVDRKSTSGAVHLYCDSPIAWALQNRALLLCLLAKRST